MRLNGLNNKLFSSGMSEIGKYAVQFCNQNVMPRKYHSFNNIYIYTKFTVIIMNILEI